MAADPLVVTPCRVLQVTRETPDTVSVTLDAQPRGWGFQPGQFNMVYAFGQGEVPLSISGDPGVPGRLVHTVRAVGAVTRALAEVRRGEAWGVRGPYGQGWPMEQARGQDLVILAGGVGLAPLRSVVLQVLRHRAEYRRVSLLYGARAPEDLLFRPDLAAWAQRPDLHVEVTVDRALPGWTGRVGVVTSLLPAVALDPAHTVALVCGPEVMMRFCARELQARGVAVERTWLSLERNMVCGVGLCGHCQLGGLLVCREGPVSRLDRVAHFFSVPEV